MYTEYINGYFYNVRYEYTMRPLLDAFVGGFLFFFVIRDISIFFLLSALCSLCTVNYGY